MKHYKHKNKFVKKRKNVDKKALPINNAPAINPAVAIKVAENSAFKLPIAEIKKDLLGTIVFAIFSIAVLIIMYLNNFGFTDVQNLISTLFKL